MSADVPDIEMLEPKRSSAPVSAGTSLTCGVHVPPARAKAYAVPARGPVGPYSTPTMALSPAMPTASPK
jgi:hypothetical protein